MKTSKAFISLSFLGFKQWKCIYTHQHKQNNNQTNKNKTVSKLQKKKKQFRKGDNLFLICCIFWLDREVLSPFTLLPPETALTANYWPKPKTCGSAY